MKESTWLLEKLDNASVAVNDLLTSTWNIHIHNLCPATTELNINVLSVFELKHIFDVGGTECLHLYYKLSEIISFVFRKYSTVGYFYHFWKRRPMSLHAPCYPQTVVDSHGNGDLAAAKWCMSKQKDAYGRGQKPGSTPYKIPFPQSDQKFSEIDWDGNKEVTRT